MEDFYQKLKNYKEINGKTFKDLGEIVSLSGDAFRMAFKNKSFNQIRKKRILAVIEGEKNEKNELDIYYTKDGVQISIDEIIAFITINIHKIDISGKLDELIRVINTVKNIKDYNHLHSEIENIKALLQRNKDILK